MRLKELALWILFLALCFSAGYIKGYFPAEMWPSLTGGPEEVEFLVHDLSLFPDSIREEVERKLSIKIKVLLVADREEFTIRTITSPGYHLALIPTHWIEPAVIANQMSNLNPLSSLISQRLSPDFQRPGDDKIYDVPLYWFLTGLYKSKASPQRYFLYQDWDSIASKIEELKIQKDQVKPWPIWGKPLWDSSEDGVWEISHLLKTEIPKDWTIAPEEIKTLYSWSLCTPRHSPSRKLTLKLIKVLLDPELQNQTLTHLNLASTLSALNDQAIPITKKPLFIRNVDLSKLKAPRHLSLEQVKELKLQFAK